MELYVSMHTSLPIYEQLKDQIRQAILKKDLLENDQLPSVRRLSKDLSIGIVTVKRAYDDLVNEGFIISQAGKGYFVNKIDIKRFKTLHTKKIMELLETIHKLASEVDLTKEEVMSLYTQSKEKS